MTARKKSTHPDVGTEDAPQPLMPHNLEAERATLGAALLQSAAADYVADHLSVESYYRKAHQVIFAAVQTLRQHGVEVDLVTLRGHLGASQMSEVGGPAYLSGLTDGVPRTANVGHYAGILEDLRGKRLLVAYARQVLREVSGSGQSATQLVADADRRLLELQGGRANGRMAHLPDSVPALITDLEYRSAHRGELLGLDTGFKSINELTFGWQPGDLIIIAARPSIGKSTFALNTAVAVALAGQRVAFFSLEMRRKQLEYRILSSLSGIVLTRLLSGYINDPDWPALNDATTTAASLQIAIDDATSRTAGDIRSACRQLKADGGLDLVVVDYVQLMAGSLDRKGATRNEEITDISRRMKTLADEAGVPLLLLSQLTRGAEGRADPKPRLTDLRESGALEQDADIVAFLHRKNHREGGATQFILEKQRNGPTGTVLLTLDRDTTLFTDGGEEAVTTPEERQAERKTQQGRFFKRRAHAR